MRACVATLLCVLILAPAASADGPRSRVVDWIDTLAIDPGVFDELQSFAAEHGEWPENSADRLASALRHRVRDDLARAMDRIARGEIEPRVDVNFLSPVDFAHGREETSDDRGRDFEDGVIRTEQVHLYEGVDIAPAEALARFTDPGFRKETSSRIASIEEENGLSCIRTEGMWGLLDPTWTCNRITLLETPEVAAEHSQVVSNPGGGDFQTIYFKESVKVFTATDQGLVLYYINYTRSAKLGYLKKKLGRGKIEDSQRERAGALAEKLHSGGR